MCCIHPSRYQVTTIRECSNHVLQLQCCNHLQHRLRLDPGPGGSDSAAQAKVAPSLWRLRRQPPAPVPVLRRCHWSFQVRVRGTTSLMSRRRAPGRAGPERLQARGPSPADSARRTRTRSRPPAGPCGIQTVAARGSSTSSDSDGRGRPGAWPVSSRQTTGGALLRPTWMQRCKSLRGLLPRVLPWAAGRRGDPCRTSGGLRWRLWPSAPSPQQQ